MQNGEVVNEESAPSIDEQMMASLEEASSENEDSQVSVTSDDTAEDNGSDTEEVEAQDEQEEEVIPKSSFLKRVNSLQASKRKSETRVAELEGKLMEYDVVLKQLKEHFKTQKTRLSEYEEEDPRDVEIRRLRFLQEQQEAHRKHRDMVAERDMQAARSELVSNRADEIVETAKSLASKYNTFSPEELVIGYSKSDGATMEQLADSLHGQRVEAYRVHLARNGSISAPKPMRTQGSRSAITGHSNDDMVTFLESIGE